MTSELVPEVTDAELRDRAVDQFRGLGIDRLREQLARRARTQTGRQSRTQRIESEFLADRVESLERIARLAEIPGALENSADREAARRIPARTDQTRISPFSPDAITRARQLVERAHRGGLPDTGAELVDGLLRESAPEDERFRTAGWVNATASEVYEKAFAKVIADPDHAAIYLQPDERDALVHARALATSPGSAGGYAVPLALDPTVILTSDGSISPLRQLARVVQLAGAKTWQGVASDGVTASWDAEGAEVSDDAPTLAGPSIDTHGQRAFVPYSVELSNGDWNNLTGELRGLLLDGATQLDNEAFITGSGSGEPTGVVTALAGTASEVTSATADVLALADVEGLQAAVPARFRGAGAFAAELAVIHAMTAFSATTNGDSVVSGDRDPRRMLGWPLRETSYMDSVIETDADVLIAGDWRSYVIVDRLGATVEPVAHLFGSNGRPTGQRGLFLFRRVGSDVVNANALRMLTIR